MGIVAAFTTALRSVIGSTTRVQAAYLQEEGMDAVRILRDDSWTNNIASQTPGVAFYLTFDGTTWKSTTTNTFIDTVFMRTATLDSVYRNGSQDIVSSGGNLDANTRKVTVSVSWADRGATTTQTLATYLTNLFNN